MKQDPADVKPFTLFLFHTSRTPESPWFNLHGHFISIRWRYWNMRDAVCCSSLWLRVTVYSMWTCVEGREERMFIFWSSESWLLEHCVPVQVLHHAAFPNKLFVCAYFHTPGSPDEASSAAYTCRTSSTIAAKPKTSNKSFLHTQKNYGIYNRAGQSRSSL